MSRKVRKYTHEFKQQAVSLALKTANVSKTASGLGIPPGTLHTWVDHIKDKTKENTKPNPTPDIATLLEENRRLHKELSIAKEEKEILKKAAAYFAQHQK
jgi:transposase